MWSSVYTIGFCEQKKNDWFVCIDFTICFSQSYSVCVLFVCDEKGFAFRGFVLGGSPFIFSVGDCFMMLVVLPNNAGI